VTKNLSIGLFLKDKVTLRFSPLGMTVGRIPLVETVAP